jgi:hypothetical protein
VDLGVLTPRSLIATPKRLNRRVGGQLRLPSKQIVSSSQSGKTSGAAMSESNRDAAAPGLASGSIGRASRFCGIFWRIVCSFFAA